MPALGALPLFTAALVPNINSVAAGPVQFGEEGRALQAGLAQAA
jgi:hypothetical protein